MSPLQNDADERLTCVHAYLINGVVERVRGHEGSRALGLRLSIRNPQIAERVHRRLGGSLISRPRGFTIIIHGGTAVRLAAIELRAALPLVGLLHDEGLDELLRDNPQRAARPCLRPACTRPAQCRGWCQSCYAWARTLGTWTAGAAVRKGRPPRRDTNDEASCAVCLRRLPAEAHREPPGRDQYGELWQLCEECGPTVTALRKRSDYTLAC